MRLRPHPVGLSQPQRFICCVMLLYLILSLLPLAFNVTGNIDENLDLVTGPPFGAQLSSLSDLSVYQYPTWLVIPDSFPESAYPEKSNDFDISRRQTPMDGMPGAVHNPGVPIAGPSHGSSSDEAPRPEPSSKGQNNSSNTSLARRDPGDMVVYSPKICPNTPMFTKREPDVCPVVQTSDIAFRPDTSVALTRRFSLPRHIKPHESSRFRPYYTATSVQPYLNHLQCAVSSVKKTLDLVVKKYITLNDAPGLLYMALASECRNVTEIFYTWAASAVGYDALVSYQRMIAVDGKKPIGMTDEQFGIVVGNFPGNGITSPTDDLVRKATFAYRLAQFSSLSAETSPEHSSNTGSPVTGTSFAKRAHKGQFDECMDDDFESDATSSNGKDTRYMRFMDRERAGYPRREPSTTSDNEFVVFTDPASRRKHCKRVVKHSLTLFLSLLCSVVTLAMGCVCYALYKHKRSITRHNDPNRGPRRQERRRVTFNEDPRDPYQPFDFLIDLYHKVFSPRSANREGQPPPVSILKRRVPKPLPTAARAASASKSMPPYCPKPPEPLITSDDEECETCKAAQKSGSRDTSSSLSSLASTGSVIVRPRAEDSKFPRTRIPTPPTRPAPAVSAEERRKSLIPSAPIPVPQMISIPEQQVSPESASASFSPATTAAADTLISVALNADRRVSFSKLPVPVKDAKRVSSQASQTSQASHDQDQAVPTSNSLSNVENVIPTKKTSDSTSTSSIVAKPHPAIFRLSSLSSTSTSSAPSRRSSSSVASAPGTPAELTIVKKRSPLGKLSPVSAALNQNGPTPAQTLAQRRVSSLVKSATDSSQSSLTSFPSPSSYKPKKKRWSYIF